MPIKDKFISVTDLERCTHLSKSDIYELVRTGTLEAHKTPKRGWRINISSAESYFDQEIIPAPRKRKSNARLSKVQTKLEAKTKLQFDSKVLNALADDISYTTTKYISPDEFITTIKDLTSTVERTINIIAPKFDTMLYGTGNDNFLDCIQLIRDLLERDVKVSIMSSSLSTRFIKSINECAQIAYSTNFKIIICQRICSALIIVDEDKALFCPFLPSVSTEATAAIYSSEPSIVYPALFDIENRYFGRSCGSSDVCSTCPRVLHYPYELSSIFFQCSESVDVGDKIINYQQTNKALDIRTRLEIMRAETAKKEHVTKNLIFSKSQLSVLAKKKPNSKEKIRALININESILERYGDDIINAIYPQ